ncbi:MAG: hypothetical protein IJ188_04165 [Clostridia bacterium]|nr:hypothetical protein [Clostridia bacterium]
MNWHTRRMGRKFALWCTLLCLFSATAFADFQIDIIPDEWTWEESGISAFHGQLTADQDLSDATLRLKVETRLEDSGEIQFLSIDGKQLKIRKRGPETVADLSKDTPLTFEGEWNLPENTDAGIAWAAIRLQVEDQEGQLLAETTLEIGDRTVEAELENSSPLKKADRIILILSVCAAAFWALAIIRYGILNRKKKGKK